MKKLLLLSLLAVFVFGSCSFHSGLTSNANLHSTEVVLSKNNFKVLETVRGDSEATYFLGLGGLKKSGMIAEARANMLENAGLEGSSRAVINETVEISRSIIFFVFMKYEVIISAHLIEFTD